MKRKEKKIYNLKKSTFLASKNYHPILEVLQIKRSIFNELPNIEISNLNNP